MVNYMQVSNAMKNHSEINFSCHIDELKVGKYVCFGLSFTSLLGLGFLSIVNYFTGGGLAGASVTAIIGGSLALPPFSVGCVQSVRLYQIKKKIFTTNDLKEWRDKDLKEWREIDAMDKEVILNGYREIDIFNDDNRISISEREMVKAAWLTLINRSEENDRAEFQGL